MILSLIIVCLAVPDVICCIDGEVRSIDIVPLAGSFEKLGVVYDSVFVEVQLFILTYNRHTFLFRPHNLNS